MSASAYSTRRSVDLESRGQLNGAVDHAPAVRGVQPIAPGHVAHIAQRKHEEIEHIAETLARHICSPVASVLEFTKALRDQEVALLDEGVRRSVESAEAACQSMYMLAMELLNYAQTGVSMTSREVVDVSEVVKEVIQGLQPLVSRTQGFVETSQLPVIHCDRAALAVLFSKLLSNAMQYHTIGVAPRIRINASRTVDHWQFRIIDNGVGIDPADQEAVFLPFVQLHASSRAGVGIGLAISRKIVELHGGSLWIESQLGKGTAVCFTLPG